VSRGGALSVGQARAAALRAQGFGDRSLRRPVEVLDRLGVIQLDSVNVLARTHDIVPFSRIGPYPLATMYQAIYAGRRGFEYWGHEASWLPIDLYRHFAFRRQSFRVREGWRGTFRPEFQQLYDHIQQRIQVEGPLGSVAFEDDRPVRGTWWDWKPAKRALEDLFACGDLTSAGRTAGFARLYELPARYLPPVVDGSDPGEVESLRTLLRRSIGALGVATALDAADYYRLNRYRWRPVLSDLVASGEVVELAVEGWRGPAYALPSTLEGSLRLPRHRPTFLSPFDNLIWFRPRDERLFDFHYRIEIYTPAPKRQYGYYVLPLLAGGRLCGRADLKMERKERRLRCHALYLHDDAFPADAADALRSLATHLGAETLAVDRVEPPGLATELARLLG
jgi:uncharacterized protein YcaQ